MKAIVGAVVDQLTDLEREVNEALFAVLVDDRIAISAELHVPNSSRSSRADLVA